MSKFIRSIDIIILIICSLNTLNNINAFLFFPAPTNMQITCGVSTPVETKPRKIFMGNGLQFNYALPNKLEDFEHPTRLQNYLTSRSLKTNGNTSLAINKPKRNIAESNHVQNYVTAGQLYKTITDGISRLKFGEDCLLKSICQLARHPFHFEDNENLLGEVIHFLLTPTLHQGFSENEQDMQNIYETAEFNGRRGVNCEEIYDKCYTSILDYISVLED